jgi:GNAT superfamily N-acetyltransferase
MGKDAVEVRGSRVAPDLAVRPAQPGDADAIASIHVAGYEDAYRGLMPDRVIDSRSIDLRRRIWRERLAANPPGQFVAVAEVDGFVAGFTSGRAAQPDEFAGGGHVGCWENMYVDPRHLGSAVGFRLGLALHEATLSSLRELGFTDAVGFVVEGNTRAFKFFEIVGWRRDGMVRESEGCQLHRMRRRLPETVSRKGVGGRPGWPR